jgi:prepilin-type N-terminal cleavage/methylation domain-containing protein
MQMTIKSKAGFTLIELMLALALLGLIGGLSAPLVRGFFQRTRLATDQNRIAQTLRHGQVLAESGQRDSPWGVRINNKEIILFAGDSYASRNEKFDEVYSLRPSFAVSGPDEFVFTKLSGRPDTTGTITLKTAAGQSRNVSVNEVGTVSF